MNLDHLNSQQQEAVKQIDGSVLILAGAGSGKTGTMIHRIAYMLSEGISPSNILAVTFTNKAAQEMRDRIGTLVSRELASQIWIKTFHSMALAILKRHADVLGYTSSFVIYDPQDQKALIRDILKQQNIELDVNTLLYKIGDYKEAIIPPAKVIMEASDTIEEEIGQVYKTYELRMRENNAMDFNDLLLNLYGLFKASDEILNRYRQQFQYIMVDEYQDTNRLQYEIIRMLAEHHGNICVVGDDDQCIYEWRGANIQNILNFERDFPGTRVIKLEQNYRSTGHILNVAHSVIKNNRGRKSKKLWTEGHDGDKVIHRAVDTEIGEAKFVASEIERLHYDKQVSYKDIAILYRGNNQSRTLESILAENKIPFRVLSGVRYYDRKEVKDMLAYLRLVVNPSDDIAFSRIINEPKRGIGDATLRKVIALRDEMASGEALLPFIVNNKLTEVFPAKARNAVSNLINLYEYMWEHKDEYTIEGVYDNLLKGSGYWEALVNSKKEEDNSRLDNLLELKTAISEFEKETEEATLEAFLESITLMSEVDNLDQNAEAVVLMTLHSSKGLEYPVVFIVGMEEEIFPSYRAIADGNIDEERRLCYVGITRAKEKLYITRALERNRFGNRQYMKKSRFLDEMDEDSVEGLREESKPSSRYWGDLYTDGPDGYAGKPMKKPFSTGNRKPYGSGNSDGLFTGMGSYIINKNTNSKKDFEPISNGQRISHAKFGKGIVVDQDNSTWTVIFDDAGTKKMAKGIAKLNKI